MQKIQEPTLWKEENRYDPGISQKDTEQVMVWKHEEGAGMNSSR